MVDLGRGGDEGLADVVVKGGVDDGEFAEAAAGAGKGIKNRLGDCGVVWSQGEDFDPITN